MKQKPLRVVVSLDVRHRASQNVIAGILRFAAAHQEWDLQMRGNHPSNDGFAVEEDWLPDGLIIDDGWRSREGGRLISSPSLKGIIFVSTAPPDSCRIPHKILTTDDRALAITAAQLFRGHGMRNFGYVGSGRNESWSNARERFFGEALSKAGFGLNVYSQPQHAQPKWKSEFNALAAWIAALSKPCGIWVAHDQRAKHVLDVCRLTKIKVPEQIQVLGVDDETYICDQTFPPLSSIAPDFERGGYAAAEALHSMMNGIAAKTGKLNIPLKSVIQRLSTTDISGAGMRVAHACEIIRKNACRKLSVRMVVRQVGGSERLLEKNFKSVLGHSIIREIQNRKLDMVRQMLTKTASPLGAIATECGFNSENYLKNLFKRRFGMTMSEFRRKVR